MLPVIRTIDQYFHLTLNEAEKAEMSELYEEAVELYEQLINKELEAYNPELLNKPQVIAANKIDAIYDEENDIITSFFIF